MIERWRAEPAAPETYRLAEGPVWDGPRNRLLWVEIEAGAVHAGRLTASGVERTDTIVADRTAGAVAVGHSGELLVAGTESLLVIGPDGAVTPGPRLLPAGGGRRLNDGRCDPDGVFLVGSLRFDEPSNAFSRSAAEPPEQPGGEELFRVGPDRAVTTIDQGLSLSNGLGWSPDGSLFYNIDTTPGLVYVRDRGGERQVLLDLDVSPDGMCVDADGNLWIAIYGAGEVRRYTPSGELTGVVSVDEPEVTCPAFVGPGLDRLLITTRPRLFLADVGVVGLPVTPWAGFHGPDSTDTPL
ncbi:MAG TPA: SMP-30/gluconolactonase/LRE family protein [Actinoplanes sp.]|nr:SMP-30/gluconolactonase/LRE family protein [Actinoplanes sp.]